MGKKEIEQKKNYELPLSIFLMGFSLNLIVLIIPQKTKKSSHEKRKPRENA